MTPAECAEPVRTHGHRVLCDPVPQGLEAVSAGRETFHGTPCLRVDLRLTPELTRAVHLRLPFARTSLEADTGLELRWREVTPGAPAPETPGGG